MKPKIITHATLKGGTGKTLLTFNIGAILAEEKKVLFIDADPQFNLTSNVGVDVRQLGLKTIQDIFENGAKAEDVIYREPIKALPNLSIIASSMFLTATELKIINLAGREKILSNFFKKNEKVISEFDYIFIDTNPCFSMINQNVFLASDSIIMPSDIDRDSIDGAEFFMALWENIRNPLEKENNVKGLILNNGDPRSKLPQELYEYCQDNEVFVDILLPLIIPGNIALKNSKLRKTPINIMEVKSGEKKARANALDSLNQYIEALTERCILTDNNKL